MCSSVASADTRWAADITHRATVVSGDAELTKGLSISPITGYETFRAVGKSEVASIGPATLTRSGRLAALPTSLRCSSDDNGVSLR